MRPFVYPRTASFYRAQAHYELHNDAMALQGLGKCLLIDPAYPEAAELMVELEQPSKMPNAPKNWE